MCFPKGTPEQPKAWSRIRRLHAYVEVSLPAGTEKGFFRPNPAGAFFPFFRFEIWKTQPGVSSQAQSGGDVKKYLDDLGTSSYNAKNQGVDHSLVMSGYRLQE